MSYPQKAVPPFLVLRYSPLVRWLYGAEFDRSTLEHIRRAPGLVVDTVRWLKHDTHLVIDGHKQ